MTFSISSVFPASHIALIANRAAAGAAKNAIYAVIVWKKNTKSSFANFQVSQYPTVLPITTRIKAPIKNVGTLSFVIVPIAKNDRIPTMNPKTPKSPATYASESL